MTKKEINDEIRELEWEKRLISLLPTNDKRTKRSAEIADRLAYLNNEVRKS